jgi:NADP-dependent aldehyde dehydrogenase
MGSVNPVFLFEEKLSSDPAGIAKLYADSISLGVGQFCTNPGIIIGIDSAALQAFISFLGEKMDAITVGKMLHQGIADAYVQKAAMVLQHPAVSIVSSNLDATKLTAPKPIIASVSAAAFLENPSLKEEVFGPFSLVVVCNNAEELKAVAAAMDGQLTSTIMATENEALANKDVIDVVAEKCGRIIMNGVPTGVEVCYAMQHGGPFPASTDSRFTSVGPDAIKRFARPMSFQNYPDALLPDELKAENPLMINRIIE